MEDIELVVKLNKDIAQGIIDGENDAPRNTVRVFSTTIADAIKNGTPLPKGHGRLIDADELKSNVEYQCLTDGSDEAEKWNDWIQRVIDAQKTVDLKKTQ